MIRSIFSVVAGYLLWTLIFLGGAAGIRSWRSEVHDQAGFTSDIPTLIIYLVVSILASLAAGFVAGKIAHRNVSLHGLILGICLLATGIPVQLSAWDKLPVWYNLVFLILLIPITLLGVKLANPAIEKTCE